MPQLDKFTYFSQFFWLCLFFCTFYIPIFNDGDGVLGISRILKLRNQLVSHRGNKTRSNETNSLEDILRKGFSTGVSYMYSSLFEVSQWCKTVEQKLYFFYIKNKAFQNLVFFFRYLLILLLVGRGIFLLFHNIRFLLFPPCYFSILPSELSLLEFYMSQPHQDPEWVYFIRQHLQSPSLSPRAYEVMVRDLINTELCFSTREQICSLYKMIFYGREDPSDFIDPIDLDLILHVHLEPFEFNHPALCQVLQSLCNEGYESTFYSAVKTANSTHFKGFLALKQKTLLNIQQREQIISEWKILESRNNFFSEQNALLRQRLGLGFQNE